MSVKLHVVMATPGKDAREFDYEFDQARISLGREDNNDIQIPLSTVSRNHAVIFEEKGEWFLEDLRSTHGTKHNGRQVGSGGKKLLRNGDVIEVVHFSITFSHGEALSDDYSQGKTEALAQRMVQEVLASMGKQNKGPYLRVMNGPDEGTQFTFDASMPEVTIGRGTDCDFQINDANISRQHAVVRLDWNDITIEDLGSKNGVVINDKKIKGRASLRDADEIFLGAVQLTFIDPSAKFIGKLDEIEAFQGADGREDAESSISQMLDSQQSFAMATEAHPSGDFDLDAASVADSDAEPPGTAEGDEEEQDESADGEDGNASEADAEKERDDDDSSNGGFGTVEKVIIGVAGFAVLGLIFGAYLLLF